MIFLGFKIEPVKVNVWINLILKKQYSVFLVHKIILMRLTAIFLILERDGEVGGVRG